MPGAGHSLLVAALRGVNRWSGAALARLEARGAARHQMAAPAEEVEAEEPHDGPPAHWLTMVRKHAPGLYARLRDEGQVRRQPEAGSGQRAAGSKQRAASSGQQAAGSRQQAAGSRQQAAGSRQQAAGNGLAASDQRPAASKQIASQSIAAQPPIRSLRHVPRREAKDDRALPKTVRTTAPPEITARAPSIAEEPIAHPTHQQPVAKSSSSQPTPTMSAPPTWPVLDDEPAASAIREPLADAIDLHRTPQRDVSTFSEVRATSQPPVVHPPSTTRASSSIGLPASPIPDLLPSSAISIAEPIPNRWPDLLEPSPALAADECRVLLLRQAHRERLRREQRGAPWIA